MITLREVLQYMATGQSFSCRVVTYDRKRKQGGPELHLPEARLLDAEKEENPYARPLTARERNLRSPRQHGHTRDPNHHVHFTRNVRVLQDGQPTTIIRKIHPLLITEFNGLELML